ncbi:MAG: aminoacyl-tRNA hydrolase [Planctomycetales bacterium]|nr:aminoacyl-tRNA hydrolase [Planctomycetales bacterium]MCA9171007.1 aminoacyl-tRNA hydrolase [Planctomycetales bacterium]
MSKLIINERIEIPFDEFSLTAVRSQGPGGQNVNKVNSKVILQWNVADSATMPVDVKARFKEMFASRITSGTITLSSQRSRHRRINQDDCLQKLRVMILDAARPPKERKATKPTRGSQVRRRRAKEMIAARKKQRQPPKLDS